MMNALFWSSKVARHNAKWEAVYADYQRNMALYRTKYWRREQLKPMDLVVETSRAYEFVEGIHAALFLRDPAVEVAKAEAGGSGDPAKARAVMNAWMADPEILEAAEDASIMALIYPCAFIKLHPGAVDGDVCALPLAPWDVLLDTRAATWEGQRFVGHRRCVPLDEFLRMFPAGKAEEDTYKAGETWEDRQKASTGDTLTDSGDLLADDDEDPHVEFWEVYDLAAGQVHFWHEAHKDAWLKSVDCPYVDGSDAHVHPICPFYFGSVPGARLEGMSALDRVATQVQEINISRTFQANAVRKASRQWLSRKGLLDDESAAKLAQGVDGEVIEVDLPAGQDLREALVPVPHTATPAEVQRYIEQVQGDIDRGSVMAQFTRGQASKATATEVSILAQYTASEVGRMARRRDTALVRLARTYLTVLAAVAPDEGIRTPLGTATPDDLLGVYRITPNDGGATPLGKAASADRLAAVLPTLAGLGADKAALLKALVSALDLPADLGEPAPPTTPPEPPQV